MKTIRSHGLRRVNTATMGLAAASLTGVALVSAVVAHQSAHPAATSLSTSTTGSSTTGSSDEGTSDDGQQAVVQAPVQQGPVQVAPQITTRHAVTSGS